MLFFCQKSEGLYRSERSPLTSLCGAFAVFLYSSARIVRGENQGVGYRFESYREEGGRIAVETHSGNFEVQPKSWLTLSGDVVYDAISGTTPTGSPPPSTITFVPDQNGNPPPGAMNQSVPLSPMTDIREGGSVAAGFSFGQHHFAPQFSISQEHDYHSLGAAFNYSIDLNEKNTTLNAGWSHNWDQVLPNGFLHSTVNKEVDDLFVGVNQLLGPKTYVNFNLTYGHSRGYLNDQYKGVLFDTFPQGDPESPALEPESRPRQRDRYIGYGSLTHAVSKLKASAEGSYRFFYDSYGTVSHTANLAWFQKVGKYLVVSPMFRYARQGAANFYVVRLPDFDTRPTYYSADYRLSKLESLTYGLNVNWKFREWFWVDAGYKRMVMQGLDSVTSASAYPTANIFTIGGRVWF